MKMVVRFGVDACLPSPDSSAAMTSTADEISSSNIQRISTSMTTTSPAINIVRAGTQVPQDALVEVASHSVTHLDRLDWNELYSQMTLSQTPALRLGVHEQAEFTELREWQLEGPDARVDTGTTRRWRGTQRGADMLDLLAQRRETAVQIVRLAKVCSNAVGLTSNTARSSGPCKLTSSIRAK